MNKSTDKNQTRNMLLHHDVINFIKSFSPNEGTFILHKKKVIWFNGKRTILWCTIPNDLSKIRWIENSLYGIKYSDHKFSFIFRNNEWKMIEDSSIINTQMLLNEDVFHNLYMLKYDKFEFMNNNSKYTMQVFNTLIIVQNEDKIYNLPKKMQENVILLNNKICKYDYKFVKFQTYDFHTLAWIDKRPLVDNDRALFVHRVVTLKNLLYLINIVEPKPYYIYDDNSDQWTTIDECSFLSFIK